MEMFATMPINVSVLGNMHIQLHSQKPALSHAYSGNRDSERQCKCNSENS